MNFNDIKTIEYSNKKFQYLFDGTGFSSNPYKNAENG